MTVSSSEPSRPAKSRRRGGRSPEIIGLPQLTPELKASIRILIVDDEDTLRDSCVSVLRYEGFQVTACSRGDEARNLLKRNKFDIAIFDLYLPEVSGLTLLRKCVDVYPDTMVIMITGNPSVESSLEALRSGQFIHRHSRRSSRPLIALNCAALPESLLESEMFGHCKGAFTGAVRDKPGLLEAANGGTLLLDELAEMSKPIQAKLLRAIQDGVVRRVGSETTDAVVNVRFIASTNRNPEEAVAAGLLRHDLYYRLRVVPIHVPPLRERPGDVKLLAEHFLVHYWSRHRGATAALPTFSDAAIRALRARPWEGNVRELQNVIEHLVVLLDPGTEIHPDDIPAVGDGSAAPATGYTIPCEVTIDEPYYQARDRLVAEFELQYLTQLINRVSGNMSRAARVANVDRTSLYRLLERHGLHRRVPTPPATSD